MSHRASATGRSAARALPGGMEDRRRRMAVMLAATAALACLTLLLVSPAWAQTGGGNVGIPIDPSAATSTTTPSAATSTTTPSAPTTTASTATTQPGSSAETTAAPDAGGTLLHPPLADFPGLTENVRFPQANVQILPEYDSQDVLVIIDYQLPPDVKVPLTFQFRAPKGARMTGYALLDAKGGFEYDRPTPKVTPGNSDWDLVEAVVPRNQPVHIEYYYNPGVVTNGARDFSVLFESPATIDQLTFSVQQPKGATGFTLTPPLSGQGQDGFGLTASSTSVSGVKPGDLLKVQVAYQKANAEPSVPAGAEPEASGETAATTNYLLWLVLAMVVGVGGFATYRMLTSRTPGPASSVGHGGGSRPRGGGSSGRRGPAAARTGAAARRSTGGQRFCTECGTAFTEDDRFCSGCGEERQD